ncbi:MAG TPA: DNA primase [Candidatus Moranbacteria bacterium]|nr:DNA primase [Candidatus Moranbacteria bacterium]HSA08212.1 DNA primase [Candidatus Moranbacteria bacterium]
MNNNVEEVKARLNIVDIVSEYVRLTKAGANWKGLCPFHHEKSPSFMVNEDKQIFHCFGCAKGGDVFTFVQEMESLEFREVLKMLADKAGVQLEQYKSEDTGNKKRILAALELATKFYETQLWKGMGKDKIMQYLHERGLTDKSIQKFRLGYAPNGWDNIIKFLTGRGFTIQEIAQTGLLVEKTADSNQNTANSNKNFYDRFRDRIMFPISDNMGNVIGYSARVAPGGDESQAKYVNTPETVVYHKSKVLYGLNHAKQDIKNKNYVLLVEGNMDVIASSQAGLGNVVAVSGTALTPDQILMLKRYTDNIAMLFDMDSAGQQAAEKSANLCFEKEMNVKVVALSDGKDAADVVQKDPSLLIKSVKESTSAMEYFFKNILGKYDSKSAEGKNNIAKDILEHVAHIENKIEKSSWIKKIAHELDVEENVINSVLKTVESSVVSSVKKQDQAEDQPAAFQKRADVIRDCLLGVIMSDGNIWKETFDKEKESEWVKNDSLISFVLESGPAANFSFDGLMLKIDDERAIEKLRKIYFDTKYRFTAEEITEQSQDDLRKMAGSYKAQYVKELQKERLHSIIREIEKAEQKGDKETLANLMSEFTKLSQETRD